MHTRLFLTAKGFTLLEVLIAMAISAIVLIGSYSLLDSVLRTDESLSRKRHDLETLQRAFHVMQQDVEQLIFRSIRDGASETAAAIDYNDLEYRFEFTRLGWRNPIGRPRSNMQRVAYVLDDGVLYREHWNVLDRHAETETKSNVLIEDVENFKVRFYSLANGGQWKDAWQKDENDKEQLPKAIQITLETERWGELTRVFSLVDNPEDNFKEDLQ